jgi:hypothetical protein
MENKCPYCDYVTPTEEPGSERGWQEIAHMQLDHPEIIAERLRGAGILDTEAGFFGRSIGPVTIHIPGDMSVEDLRRLVQIVADANKAADMKDEQIQRIETTLDSTLLQLEK